MTAANAKTAADTARTAATAALVAFNAAYTASHAVGESCPVLRAAQDAAWVIRTQTADVRRDAEYNEMAIARGWPLR